LVAGLVRDPNQTIYPILAASLKHDELMTRLVQLSEAFDKRRKSGAKVQNISMINLRVDYMVDWYLDATKAPSLKLVEYNTIATGMGPATAKANQMQNYIANKYRTFLNYTYGNDGDNNHFAKKDPSLQGNFILEPSQGQIDSMVM
jgi:glutathione synthase